MTVSDLLDAGFVIYEGLAVALLVVIGEHSAHLLFVPATWELGLFL